MRQSNDQWRNREGDEAARLAESAAILRRVRQETEPQTGAGFGRLASGIGRHLSGESADAGDPIELWGTRIGRGLGLVAFVGLLALLAWQLGS
ncbi:hypothetical protein [Aureimonas leprariae]|uniref:Uncharacterized protein n=1 Tax=Plantimonas leprariae TaxID=2615207 RepID=A0A7V7PLX1_9HYPH|nr:hypothetical protein [Aureimonas leprariae]KAB0677582.1 hypothetical protein F6X38_18090 [Aureimonas leprariae]